MKAVEILNEYSGVEPKPASLVGQGLKRIGAAALGALGAKNAADVLSGSADIGAKANAYNNEFTKYLKSKNKTPVDVEYVDLNDFIEQNSLPSPNLPNSGYVAPGDLKDIFLDIAKLSAKSAPAAGSNTQTTAGANQTSAPSQTSTTAKSNATSTTQSTTQSAAPEQPKEVPTATSKVVNADQLLAAFQDYVDADGKITPELRGVVKTLWMKMGGTKAESVKKSKAKL